MTNKIQMQFGTWHVGETSITLNGILNLWEETGELNLFSDEPLSIPYNIDVIYGKTYQGAAFTLYECTVGGNRSTSIVHDYKSKYNYKINCNYIIEGATFTSEQEILVNKVYFSVTNLNKWAFQDAIDVELNDSADYLITTNKIDDITHKNEEFEFTITYNTMPDYNYHFTSSLKVSTNVQLVLNFEKPTSLKRVHSLIYKIRDFYSLCINSSAYIEYISAEPHYTVPLEIVLPLKIYGKAFEFGKNENIKELKNYDTYISFEDIKKDFDACMKNWFEKSKKLKPVIDLYLSLNYHSTSMERHFLNLVQALEAYHRLTRKNYVLPKEEHARKVESIIDNVPEDYKDWLKGKLSFSNEPSLHERLEDLLTPTSDTDSPEYDAKYHHLFRLRDKEKIEIIRDIKNTRNYNTHFDEKLLKKSVKGENLYQLILLLSLVIEYHLLMELEIDESIVIDLIWEKTGRISTRNSLIEATRDGNIKL